jgi:23S rRNA-intervening sequence protein
MRDSSKADELEQRLIAFGAEIISLSAKLPRTPQGRHVAQQMLRCGTATAANYGEARGAESRSDFVYKLRVVLKELNETGDLAADDRKERTDSGRRNSRPCSGKPRTFQNNRSVSADGSSKSITTEW